jgi:Polysulphide reductase, NrfD
MSEVKVAPESLRLAIPGALKGVFAALVAVGAAAFLMALSRGEALRAWEAYLVNFLFWTGLSFGAVLFAAVLNMTGARWGRSAKRLAEAFSSYLPVAFLLFWILYFGRRELFHWVDHPVAGKELWLNPGFVFLRDGAGLLLLSCLSVALTYFSVKGDRVWLEARDAGGDAAERAVEASFRSQVRLSPAIAIAFAFVLSLVAFDMVMSLDTHWYSTLFGGYFFVGCFYTGIASLYLLSLVSMKNPALGGSIGKGQLHDLGKLLLAFSLLTGYLFYVQFLVIWYANLPEETRFVILRVKTTAWEPLAWAILFMVFILPFFVLLSRRIKTRRTPMIVLCVMILTGMWLERFILVAPSLWGKARPAAGLLELCITAGFFGVVMLCLAAFFKRVPAVPVSDPLFRKLLQEKGEALRP